MSEERCERRRPVNEMYFDMPFPLDFPGARPAGTVGFNMERRCPPPPRGGTRGGMRQSALPKSSLWHKAWRARLQRPPAAHLPGARRHAGAAPRARHTPLTRPLPRGCQPGRSLTVPPGLPPLVWRPSPCPVGAFPPSAMCGMRTHMRAGFFQHRGEVLWEDRHWAEGTGT